MRIQHGKIAVGDFKDKQVCKSFEGCGWNENVSITAEFQLEEVLEASKGSNWKATELVVAKDQVANILRN